MVEQYKGIGGVEFHPVKSEWAEKEFIGALDIIDIPDHTVAWVHSRVLLLRNKEWDCVKFTNQHKAESAFRKGITTLNTPGTIDSGYRGEVKVILINHGHETFHIEKGMRIAQLAIRSVPEARFAEVDALADSERGSDGFGSTGF